MQWCRTLSTAIENPVSKANRPSTRAGQSFDVGTEDQMVEVHVLPIGVCWVRCPPGPPLRTIFCMNCLIFGIRQFLLFRLTARSTARNNRPDKGVWCCRKADIFLQLSQSWLTSSIFDSITILDVFKTFLTPISVYNGCLPLTLSTASFSRRIKSGRLLNGTA